MVEYKCQKCNKIYNNKYNLQVHLNRKRPCDAKEKSNINSKKIRELKCENCTKSFTRKDNLKRHLLYFCKNKNIIIEDENFADQKDTLVLSADALKCTNNNNTYITNVPHFVPPQKNICNYCKKNFAREDSLMRHIDFHCRVKKEQTEQNDSKYNELLKEIQKLKKQNKVIDELKKEIKEMKNKKVINKTINNTQNIVINQNIKLVAFGKEDLDEIKDNIYKKILNKGFNAVPSLIEYTHFNKNKPENHNVYIPNIRDKYAMIFDGNKWNLHEYNEIITQLCEDKKVKLEDKFSQFFESLDECTKKKFERFLNEAETDSVKTRYKNDIKLILYNNRNLTINTKNKLENDNRILND